MHRNYNNSCCSIYRRNASEEKIGQSRIRKKFSPAIFARSDSEYPLPLNSSNNTGIIDISSRPSGVTSIGSNGSGTYHGFAYCEKLEKLRLPNSINNIIGNSSSEYYRPFYNCSSLKEIYIPSTLTKGLEYIAQSSTNLVKVDTNNVDSALQNWNETPVNNNATATLYENGTLVTKITLYKNNVCGFNNEWEVSGIENIKGYTSWFRGCTFLSDVHVQLTYNYPSDTNTFKNCTFNKDVYVYNTLAAARFNNCVFNGKIILDSVSYNVVPSKPMFYNCGSLNIHIKNTLITTSSHGSPIAPDWNAIICKQSVSYINTSGDDISRVVFEDKNDAISIYMNFDCSSKLYYINELSQMVQWSTPEDLELKSNVLGNIGYLNVSNKIKSIQQKNVQIKEVLDYCFYKTNNYYGLDLSTVTDIGEYAFAESNIIVADFPNVTSIPSKCFYNCKQLQTIDLSIVTTIGDDAFRGCSKLSEVISTSNLKSIGNNCFYDSTITTILDLSEVKSIPSTSINEIGNYPPFKRAYVYFDKYSVNSTVAVGGIYEISLDNKSLINMPVVIRSQSGAEMYVDGELLTNLEDTDYTTLYTGALANVSSLQTASFENVQTLGDYVFYNDINLKKVVLPEHVSKIGSNCFYKKLNNSSISGNTTELSEAKDGLNICILAETPPTLSGGLYGSSDSLYVYMYSVFVPDNAVSSYKSATNWSRYNIYGLSEYFEWDKIENYDIGFYTPIDSSIGAKYEKTNSGNSSYRSVIIPCEPGMEWVGKPYYQYSYYLDENGCILQKVLSSNNTSYKKYTAPDGAKSLVYVEYSSTPYCYIKQHKTFENPW